MFLLYAVSSLLLIIARCNSELYREKTPDGRKVLEGDMIMSDEQHEMFYGDSSSMRKGMSMQKMLWPDGIVPFKITLTANKDRPLIENAIKIWTEKTCLHFKEIPANEVYKDSHIFFVRGAGCWSDIGRKFWQNGQEISLNSGCDKLYTAVHEIGHAIGFFHEQSRKDRDDFIKIFKKNLVPKKDVNFEKQTYASDYGIPYDYDSVMHYSMYAFSDNNEKTIATHDPTKQFLLGQRDHLSFYDIKLANTMYKCNSKCKQIIECSNEGFVDSSCTCICKPGFGGKTCDLVEPVEGTCGGIINQNGATIRSTNFPSYYPRDEKCVWWIKAPENNKVEVTFTKFAISRRETDGKMDCYFDKMEIRTKDVYHGDEFCGEELLGKSIKSVGNSLVLLFQSGTMGFEKAFEIKVKFI